MAELERLIRELRKSIEVERLKHLATNARDLNGFINDIAPHKSKCLREISLIKIENIGRPKIAADCDAREQQVNRIIAQAVDDFGKAARVAVA